MCFKFRTMFVVVDTSVHRGHLNDLMNSNAPMVKMDSHGDPRLIPFGLWLRSTGLDEIPQRLVVARHRLERQLPVPAGGDDDDGDHGDHGQRDGAPKRESRAAGGRSRL